MSNQHPGLHVEGVFRANYPGTACAGGQVGTAILERHHEQRASTQHCHLPLPPPCPATLVDAASDEHRAVTGERDIVEAVRQSDTNAAGKL